MPAPVLDLGHVLAVLADIKSVPLHCGPVAVRRALHLVAQTGRAPDHIECELIAVEMLRTTMSKGVVVVLSSWYPRTWKLS